MVDGEVGGWRVVAGLDAGPGERSDNDFDYLPIESDYRRMTPSSNGGASHPVHLRVAWRPPGGRRAIGSCAARRGLVLLVAALLAGACGAPSSTDDVSSSWTLDPSTPTSREPMHLVLALRNRAGQPVRGAKLQMAAHMAQPGMAPLVTDAAEDAPGSYTATFQFTMSGDWTVVASGTLADGRRITRSAELRTVK
jgi:hypothetical protein